MLKKIALLVLPLLLWSCSLDDNSPETYYEILPVEDAVVPSEFELNQTYEITMTYARPTSCHAFNDIYYLKEGKERIVAVVATVFESNTNCEPIDAHHDVSFNFVATESGTYTFKFWQGEDDNENDVYMTIEVPVID